MPWDRNVVTKEDEKGTIYSLLAKEIIKMQQVLTPTNHHVLGGWLFGHGIWLVGGFFERYWDSRCVGRNVHVGIHLQSLGPPLSSKRCLVSKPQGQGQG